MAEEKPAAAEATPAPASPKAPSPWLPVIVVMVLMPAISFAVTQFVMIPKLKAAQTDAPAKAKGSESHGAPHASKEKTADSKQASYEFPSVVVNLSGAMGTRYLKVTFTCFGSRPDLKEEIEAHKPQLQDLAIGVLSSRTLADLENNDAKNSLRTELQTSFNRALGGETIEQIYFSDFVIQ